MSLNLSLVPFSPQLGKFKPHFVWLKHQRCLSDAFCIKQKEVDPEYVLNPYSNKLLINLLMSTTGL